MTNCGETLAIRVIVGDDIVEHSSELLILYSSPPGLQMCESPLPGDIGPYSDSQGSLGY